MGTKFKSTRLYDGYSACFRQWRAEGTHCKFLHGYGISFKVTFEGELDHRNWVADFGFLKRSTAMINGKRPDKYFQSLFDHTVIVAHDDPALPHFQSLADLQIIQLVVMQDVGCEKFAEFILTKFNELLRAETSGRVKATSVEVFEHPKNSAIAYLQEEA
jgi:6-pyruvoyltetrahydropterin/6-carboxytetrahydropterin synthase